MKKPVKCKICGSEFHYQTFCPRKPKKAIKINKPIISSKPNKLLKRSYIKPKSTSSERKKLIYELDRVFSIYIRLKDSKDDMSRCVTCGTVRNYKLMQNGHFIPRGKFITRWDEKNCHVQCNECNEDLNGNLERYREYMIDKYGIDELIKLEAKSRTGIKIQTYMLSTMISKYKNMVKFIKDT